MDLILRPSSLNSKLPWALQLRQSGMPETEYYTLCRVNRATADKIIEAGACFWLFGEPKE